MPPPSTSTTTTKPPAPKSDWVETETGNKVSRRSQLHGTQHITLGGRCVIHATACIRGDLVRAPPPPPPSSTSNPSTQSTSRKPAPPPTSVSLGKYTILSGGALLKPPSRPSPSQGTTTYHALHMGSHAFVGVGCVVQAAQIGDHVVVEEGAVVGSMAILKEGCRVLAGSVVPEGMVVGPGLVVGGRPARVVGETGVGWGVGEDEGGVGGRGGGLREVWRGVGRE